MGTIWTDDPITTIVQVKRVHILELQTNINRLRQAKGLLAYVFINIPLQAIIDDSHIIELKNVLSTMYPNISWNYDFTNITTEQVKCDHVAELRRQINIIDGVLVEYKSSALDWFFRLDENGEQPVDLIAFEFECPTSYELTKLLDPIISGLTGGTNISNLQFNVTNKDPNLSECLWEVEGNPSIISGSLVGNATGVIKLQWGTPGLYNIRCKLIGDQTSFADSNWSNSITVNIAFAITPLATPVISPPSDTLINTNILYVCNSVTNAVSYMWEFGASSTIISGGNTNSIMVQWSQAGTYAIRCKAIGNGTTYSDSPWSNTDSITITAAKPQLAQPSITCSKTLITPNESTNFICAFDSNSESITWHMTGDYNIISGSQFGTRANNITVMWGTPGIHTVKTSCIAAGFEDSIFSNVISVTCNEIVIPPVITGPATTRINEAVCIYRVSGTSDHTVSSYTWNVLNGDSILIYGAMSGSNEMSISFKWATAGTGQIRCKKILNTGGISDWSNTVSTVISNAPVVLPAPSNIISIFDSSPSQQINANCSFYAIRDSRAQSIQWTITGDYTLVTGSLNDNATDSTIIVKWASAGTYQVSAKNIGDGNYYMTSPTITETVIITDASVRLGTPTISTSLPSTIAGTQMSWSVGSGVANAGMYMWVFSHGVICNATGTNSNIHYVTTPYITFTTNTATRYDLVVKVAAAPAPGSTAFTISEYSQLVTCIVQTDQPLPTTTTSATSGATSGIINNAYEFNVNGGVYQPDANSTLIWTITGNPTVVSGSLTGSPSDRISVKWSSAGTYSVASKHINKYFPVGNWSNYLNMSITSAAVTLATPIISPSNKTVTVNQTTTLTISPIPQAISYTWLATDKSPTIVAGGNGSTSISLRYGQTGSAVVQCRAIGDGTLTLSSNWSTYATITVTDSTVKLATPTTPSIQNQVNSGYTTVYTSSVNGFWLPQMPTGGVSIAWTYTGSPTIIGYGSVYTSNDTIKLTWPTAGTYTIRGQYVGNGTTYLSSDWGTVRNVTVIQSTKLATPVISNPSDTLTDTAVLYTCTAVSGATGYSWEFTEAYQSSNSPSNLITLYASPTNSISLKWATPGAKTVKVRAIAPETEAYTPSDYSTVDSLNISSVPLVLGSCTTTGPDTFTTTSGMINEYYGSIVPNATSYTCSFSPDSGNISFGVISGTNGRGIKVGVSVAGTYTITIKALANGYSAAPTNISKTITVTAAAVKLATPVLVGSYPASWFIGDVNGGQYSFTPPTGATAMGITGSSGLLVSTESATSGFYAAQNILTVSAGVLAKCWVKSATAGSFSVDFNYSGPGYTSSNTLTVPFVATGTKLATPVFGSYSASATVNTNLQFSVTLTNPATYSSLKWTIGGPAYTIISGSLTGSASNTIGVKFTQTGTASITCQGIGNGSTYANSDVSPVASLSVTSGTILAKPVISGPTGINIGKPATYSITAAVPNASSYYWTIPSSIPYTIGAGSINVNSSSPSIVVTWTGSGTGVVGCKSIGNGSTYLNSDFYTINTTVFSPLIVINIPTVVTPSGSCVIGSEQIIKCNAVNNASSYQWTITGGPTVVSGSLNSIGVTVKWMTAGTYNFSVVAVGDGITYTNSPSSQLYTMTVTGLTKLATPVLTSMTPTSPIVGQQAIATIRDGSPNASSYTWSMSGSYSVVAGALTGSLNKTITCIWTTAGQFSIVAKAIGNGVTYSDSDWSNNILFSVQSAPQKQKLNTPIISGPASLPVGTQTRYDASATPNTASWTWYVEGGGVSSIVSGVTGSYLMVTATTGGLKTIYCQAQPPTGSTQFETSNAGSLSINALLVSQAPLATPVISCAVASAGVNVQVPFTIAAIANATSYAWSITGQSTIVAGALTGSSATSITIKWGTAGTYNVTCQAMATGQIYTNSRVSDIKSITISATMIKLNTPIITGSANINCNVPMPYVAGTVGNAGSYTWSTDSTGITISAPGTGQTANITATTLGMKTIKCRAMPPVSGSTYSASDEGQFSFGVVALTFVAPSISGPASGLRNTNYTFSLSVYHPTAVSNAWNITGTPTIVSGSLTGTTGTSITVKWATANTWVVQCRQMGDGTITISGPYQSKNVLIT